MATIAQNHSSYATDLNARKSNGRNFGKTEFLPFMKYFP